MPVLNEADEVYYNNQRVDRIYLGTELVWPETEKWSNWMLVGSTPVAGPAAWFDPAVTHYDSGTHHQLAWRYSNHGRIRYHGLCRTLSAVAYGGLLVTCNLDPVASGIPYPSKNQMSFGIASPDITATWIGAPLRVDLVPDATYHHKIVSTYLNGSNSMAAGIWFELDTMWTFGGET